MATKHDFSTFREVDMSHDLHDMDDQASRDMKSECTQIETRQIKYGLPFEAHSRSPKRC